MIALYGLTIFLSAALLFLIQPMFARVLLPEFGGSPGVWNAAMVFYQSTLLVGYAYAHAGSVWLGAKRQAVVHVGVLAAAALTLPLALPAGWSPPLAGSPTGALLGLMVTTVGATFFAVSTTSPVLQRWLASTAHPTGRDPYFLYAAGNAGSMLALLSYPLWFEPTLRLQQQLSFWAWGFVAFAVLVGGCAITLWRAPTAPAEEAVETAERLNASRRVRWVLLAFVPSSLMLGLTTYFSTEIAVVPMLWVIPLALYLLTLTAAFARHKWTPLSLLNRAFPILAVVLVLMLNMLATEPVSGILLLHLVVFFVASLLCHSQLAADRPGTGFLTEYYLWMAVGGAMGGVFNALIAPVLFNSVAEYPIAIALACWLGLPPGTKDSRNAHAIAAYVGDYVWPLVLGAATIGAAMLLSHSRQAANISLQAMVFGIASLAAFLLSRRPLRFALGVGALLLAGMLHPGGEGRVLLAQRSFFGIHRVTEDPDGRFHQLIHGTTLHGRQSLEPARAREPLTYYHRTGPAGDIFSLYRNVPDARIAVIGLGAGSLASYSQPSQQWTYFEIDPTVVAIARDRQYFTFLADSLAPVRTVVGDARQSLAREPDGAFDLIVLDAYTSDAIPVHLATSEALAEYTRKLRPAGRLAFHISNNYFDLEPVFGNLARKANLASLTRSDSATAADIEAGKSSSVWLVMAQSAATVAPLSQNRSWNESRMDPRHRVWSDDYSNLIGVLRWR